MDGIINVYKEAGYTSFDVCARLRGILKTKKIGHTGTLDPDAVGVLPVCVGSATSLCDMLTEKVKEYEARILFGIATDTEDVSGKVLEEGKLSVTEEKLKDMAASFVGPYDQVPPMYSALKVNGKKLCDLARSGIFFEPQPRKVEIYSIDVYDVLTKDGFVEEASLRVSCSKGTYIRSLCRDIGKKLGCPACMKALKRTKSGMFGIEDSLKLAEIEEKAKSGSVDGCYVGIEDFFANCDTLKMKQDKDKFLLNGNKLELEDLEYTPVLKNGRMYRVYDSLGAFRAVYIYNATDGIFKPFKMFLN